MELRTRMKDNLTLLRNCAGWTTTEMGERLGVTRQTIYAFEKDKQYQLSMMNYLAIRKVFEDEIYGTGEARGILSLLLDCLIDFPDRYSQEEQNLIRADASLLAPAIMKQPEKRKQFTEIFRSYIEKSGVSAGASLSLFL